MVLDAPAEARGIALHAAGADWPEFDLGLRIGDGKLNVWLKLFTTDKARHGSLEGEWRHADVHGRSSSLFAGRGRGTERIATAAASSLGMLYRCAWELRNELHPAGPATKCQQLPICVRELHRLFIGPVLQNQRGCFRTIVNNLGDAGPIGDASMHEEGGETALAERSASTLLLVRTQPRCHHDLHSQLLFLMIHHWFLGCGGRGQRCLRQAPVR